MKNSKNVWIEAVFTFKCYTRSLSFRLIAILGIVALLLLVNADRIIDRLASDEPVTVGVVVPDGNGMNSAQIMNTLISTEAITYAAIPPETAETEIGKIGTPDETYPIVAVVNPERLSVELHVSADGSTSTRNAVTAEFERITQTLRLERMGYEVADIDAIMQNSVSIIPSESSAASASLMTMLGTTVLFFVLLFYVTYLSSVVIEEKTGRISETLLSYAKPLELLFGKLLGVFGAMLVHVSLFVGIFWVATNAREGGSEILTALATVFTAKTLIFLFVMIICGYLCYGFLAMCASSFATTMQDASVTSLIQSMVLLVSYYTSYILSFNFNETILYALSFVPFISVFSNLLYVSVMNPSWAVIIQFIVVQFVLCAIVGIICSKLFRRGIASYGKKNSRKEKPVLSSNAR